MPIKRSKYIGRLILLCAAAMTTKRLNQSGILLTQYFNDVAMLNRHTRRHICRLTFQSLSGAFIIAIHVDGRCDFANAIIRSMKWKREKKIRQKCTSFELDSNSIALMRRVHRRLDRSSKRQTHPAERKKKRKKMKRQSFALSQLRIENIKRKIVIINCYVLVVYCWDALKRLAIAVNGMDDGRVAHCTHCQSLLVLGMCQFSSADSSSAPLMWMRFIERQSKQLQSILDTCRVRAEMCAEHRLYACICSGLDKSIHAERQCMIGHPVLAILASRSGVERPAWYGSYNKYYVYGFDISMFEFEH